MIAFKAFDHSMVLRYQSVDRYIGFNQSGFYIGLVSNNHIKVTFDIFIGHRKTDKSNRRQILFVEILPPVERDIAALYDQILFVLDRGLDHLPHDRPEIRSQRLIITQRRQFSIPAADKPHLQMVDRQIGIFELFQHPLRKKRFPGVGCAGYQYNHIFPWLSSLFLQLF